MRMWLGLLMAMVPGIAAAAPPVVVELFTSEGCSSCPPADRLLGELAKKRPDVLPLAFHITYWDRLGWPDPYALAAATARQRDYAAISAIGGVYTPQAVVDGRVDVVGSDAAGLRRAIAAAAARTNSVPVTGTREGDTVLIALGAGTGAGRVVVVGYDPHHVTDVARGENAGARLEEFNIVRGIALAGAWDGAAAELRVARPAGERLAVLVQAPNGAILGAARVE